MIKKAGYRYNFINIIVLLITIILFLDKYIATEHLFDNIEFLQILILIFAVCMVHAIKAGRLYLVLYGSDISFLTYIKTYCKVTPVSVILPFKIGEFFRMYCYGRQLNNYLKGIVIIILDRFMDTIALITMILLIWAFNGWHITSFVYILLVFLLVIVSLYMIFPNVYSFWMKYLLSARATQHRLTALNILDKLNIIYKEITNVSKGRGAILYFMSLVAWIIEIGSVAILNGFTKEKQLDAEISEYLSSAISGNQSVELKRFIFVSILLLVIIYIAVKIVIMVSEKRKQK